MLPTVRAKAAQSGTSAIASRIASSSTSAARAGALVGRLELDGELLDDLDLTLGRHRERGQLRSDVVTPVDRHYAGRIFAT